MTSNINRKKIVTKLFLHLILILVSISMVFPFLWMISTSLKSLDQVFLIPPIWIPKPLQWENYLNAWNALPFGNAYLNSLKIALICVIGQLITC